MATYKTPGVYVEEISTLPASVAQVETAIPAFIGYTEKAMKRGESLILKPTRIKSFPEYEELFGGPEKETKYTVTVNDYVDANGELLNRVLETADPKPADRSKYQMWYQMQMYFANGGGPCYIVSVAGYSDNGVKKGELSTGLDALKMEDEPTLILFPDATKLAGVNAKTNFFDLYKSALDQCELLKDRFTIIDTYDDGDTAVADLRDKIGTNNLKYGAAYYPFLKTSLNYSYDEAGIKLTHNVYDPDAAAAAAVDPNDPNAAPDPGTLHEKALSDTEVKDKENGLYNMVKNELNAMTITLSPSCTMAGIYARVDSDRGVWKAPANVSLTAVVKPSLKITNEDQESLNIDVNGGKSVNAIRSFTGKGILVWGARTLAGNDNEWRYVSVRRFYNMVEESVKKATERVVFEPNDANTWIKSKAQIENFLNNLWRQGALAGAVPEQAFFVNVGLGTTMTAQDILEGRMIIEIGMAVVRPAEFIILRFSHKMQES